MRNRRAVRQMVLVSFVGATLSSGCSLFPSASSTADTAASDDAPIFDPELFFCGLGNCTLNLVRCFLDPACSQGLLCHARCGSGGARQEQQACHLTCQLGRSDESAAYRSLIQCFANNGCLPTLPPGRDGSCLVTEENRDTVVVLPNLDELEGTWREVRGLNCGAAGSGYEGGYDALPCRVSSWVFADGQWWYHTTFCAPNESGGCGDGEPVVLIAEPSLSDVVPGLLEVPYANPPLQPQDEEWYVLSRPDPDWILYTYCGSTPVGSYAGANIMTRSPEASDAAMPPEVEAAFREAASAFGFSYDQMCVTEHTTCPPVDAAADVRAWLGDQSN